MSGGVDSSVAAALLVEQGHEVIGATMKLFCYGDDVPDRPCCSLDSINDARDVAHALGIPHYLLNLEDRFNELVILNFVDEYSRGRTPIPCVRCNSFTKFRDLLAHADALGCDAIATGHYAIARDGELYRGLDPNKDQSYFLWGIDRAVVGRMLTPGGRTDQGRNPRLCPEARPGDRGQGGIGGDLLRAQRRLRLGARTAPARRRAGAVARPARDHHRRDHRRASGFCPVYHRPAARPARWLRPADLRRGDPAGGPRPWWSGPIEALEGHQVSLEEVNWLAAPLTEGDGCLVQIRYRSRAVPATVAGIASGGLQLLLSEPARAITPGQSGVLYSAAGRVLGGGVIS